MPRVEDIAWKFVVRRGKKWLCPYCHKESSGSVTRVRSHFLKQPKQGIASCTRVPEHISTLMELLHNHEVHNKEDIAWKFVNRVEDSKWRCHYCSGEFFGDLTGVKGHLLGVPNEGVSICREVPDHVRMLMRSLLDEVAEEASREANGQSSTEPQAHDMPTQAEVSREANGQFSMESQTRDMPIPEVAEEESREVNRQFSVEPEFHDTLPAADPLSSVASLEYMEDLQYDQASNELLHAEAFVDHDPALAVLLSAQDSHVQPAFLSLQHQSINHETRDMQQNATMPLDNGDTAGAMQSQVQNSHGQPESSLSPCPEEMPTNDQQTPTGASLFQDDQLRTQMEVDPPIASQHTSESSLCSMGALEDEVLDLRDWPGQPERSLSPCPEEMPTNDQQTPTGASLFQDDQLQTQMEVDPPIASQHTTEPPITGATDLQVPEVATNTTGPSSSQDMNRGSPIMNVCSTYAKDEEMRKLKRKVEELNDREAVTKKQMGLESAASSVWKKPRISVQKWLKKTERAIYKLIGRTLPQKLLREARDAKGDAFLERKLIGEAIQTNIELIWDRLKQNHTRKFGIYGMGGVGKTTIMMHIHNRLLKDSTFDGVAFITMPQDFSNYKLQSDILEALKLGDTEDEHEKKRAAKLSKHLERKKNCVLILDNVWNHFDLEEVGIPVGADGIKLVLTTRSIDVCHQMHCRENIEIKPLSQEEAKNLFLEELGSEVIPDSKIKALMTSIVRECAGLPIGLITMARSMRGKTGVFEWRDSLLELRESSKGQTTMEQKVLMNLKFSYDHLDNPNVQRCFLSCALYPEGEFIDKYELVEFFIDQGLIGGLNTRKEQYDRGLIRLKKLRNACLLEDHGSTMKMHDLIRDMALNIMSATSIVQAGKQLMRIPSEERWTDALEKVSLMKNDIRAFPLNMSPNCPKLSTLLLNGCWSRNVVVPDSFFKNLLGLKVLNLSGCHLTELPNSISDLVNLRALLLQRCRKLRRIPFLEKLTSLRKLDVSGCHMLEAPEGLGRLVNLEYLDLGSTGTGRLPKGTLGGLLNLQYLKVGAVDGEDITKLKALETLKWLFWMDVDDFNECVRDDFNECVRAIDQINPFYYDLYVDGGELIWDVEVNNDAPFRNGKRKVAIFGASHAIVSMGGECTGNFTLIPQHVQTMIATGCDSVTNLSGMGPLEYLEKLEIEDWENLRVLCGGHDSTAPTPTPLLFPSLRVLNIEGCPKLKYLFGHGSTFKLPHLREIKIRNCEEMVGIIAAVTSPPHPLLAFPSLEVIDVEGCDKMKRAVEFEWMPCLPHLKSITVSCCKNMEEIIRGPPPNLPGEGISLESVEVECCNNMRKLFPLEWLLHLRNLQNIYVGMCNGMVEMISGAGQGQEASIMTHVNNTHSSFQPSSISLSKLKVLYLRSLPQLKSICRVPISCNSMEELGVYKCPELKGIPLQLQLRETEELPHIWVEDEEKWKTLMWDRPNAEAILQPYLRKGEHANHQLWKETDWKFSLWVDWQSPNPIELDAKGKNPVTLVLKISPAT